MAKKTNKTAQTDAEALTFEQALDELQTIVGAMEEGEVPLGESVAQYERGVSLIRRCRKLLGEAEKRVELLSEDDAGQPGTEPIEGDEA
ncbi:MAG: Exodeoxyribonuclease 7 small subunit [Phycisphaerae bacterium]|nr:Exodeoxyribonuclease 7 small subunit [Phycisphaerae bacterium]